MEFNFTDDYNTEFKAYVDELFTKVKEGHYADRDVRIALIDRLIESYFEVSGETPDGVQLDRLGTLILNEEYTDKDRMKVRNNENPVLSEDQLSRRRENEVSPKWGEEVGTDGRDYRPKVRDSNRKLREISGVY